MYTSTTTSELEKFFPNLYERASPASYSYSHSHSVLLPWPRFVESAMIIRHLFRFFLLLLLFLYQAVTQSKNKNHMTNIPQTPNIFTDYGPPIKWLLGGPISSAPSPPKGGAKVFLGGLWLIDHSDPIESNIFGELLTQIYFQLFSGSPPTPQPPYPPRHQKGGPVGGPGGLNVGGWINVSDP